MKTTIRHGECLWRGKELPALAESITPYLEGGALDVLFASNLDLENSHFNDLLGLLVDVHPSNDIYIYYPSSKTIDIVSNSTPRELISYIVADGSEAVYVFDEANSYLVYSNTRDGLSFWIVPKEVLQDQHFQIWDSDFEDHLRTTGIGFGDEGKRYSRDLLTVLMKTNARSYRRFSPMLQAFQ